MPRLFMAVAQAPGSDMGIVMELESMLMLRIPCSGERKEKERGERESLLLAEGRCFFLLKKLRVYIQESYVCVYPG